MNLNLPQAWLLSCVTEDLEMNDRTILIPSLQGVKVSDVVFIGDAVEGKIYAEAMVKSVNDSNVELMITASIDEHPLLTYDALISRGFIPANIYGGYEKLSNEGFVTIRSIFRDPLNHRL